MAIEALGSVKDKDGNGTMKDANSTTQSLTPQEKLRRDLSQAPTVHATTKDEILNAPLGAAIKAPSEVWEELGMDVPDNPSNYL